MSRRVKDQNKTFGQVYREIEKQTGIRPSALNGPRLPDAGTRVWCWFQDLSRRRGYQVGMSTVPQPVPFSEVRAYFELTGETIEPWQRRLLADLDDMYLTIATGEEEPGSAVSGASALKLAVTSESKEQG